MRFKMKSPSKTKTLSCLIINNTSFKEMNAKTLSRTLTANAINKTKKITSVPSALLQREDFQNAYDEIYSRAESFSKDHSLKKAERVRKLRPEIFRNEEDWFYGEISHDSMLDLIDLCLFEKESADLIYCDLGSGCGKQVAIAALSERFKKAKGIEICGELAQKANEGVRKLKELIGSEMKCEIDAIEGDMFRMDVSEADMVFVHATTFHDTTVAMLKAKLSREMKIGARLAIVSKMCDDVDNFEPLKNVPGGIGWKPVDQVDERWQLDCYLYEKVKEV